MIPISNLKGEEKKENLQVAYFYGVSDVDDKCIRNGANGHPCVVSKNLKPY